MAAVRIFGTVISTYTRIVEITAEEAGLSHETIATAAQSPQNRHPFSKVPVVEIDGLELIESVAIAHYIDNAHGDGALQPTDPAKRAVMDKWIAVANNYLFPLFEHGLVMPWIMHRVAGFDLDRTRYGRIRFGNLFTHPFDQGLHLLDELNQAAPRFREIHPAL